MKSPELWTLISRLVKIWHSLVVNWFLHKLKESWEILYCRPSLMAAHGPNPARGALKSGPRLGTDERKIYRPNESCTDLSMKWPPYFMLVLSPLVQPIHQMTIKKKKKTSFKNFGALRALLTTFHNMVNQSIFGYKSYFWMSVIGILSCLT